MLDQAAQTGVVDLLAAGARGKRGDLLVLEKRFSSAFRCGFPIPAMMRAARRTSLPDPARGREIIARNRPPLFHPHQLVNGELRAVLINLDQALHPHEVVAIEGVHHLGDVVPHLGVDVAGAVAQDQRQVRLAALLLADVLRLNQEHGRDHLVRLQLADVGRFHSTICYFFEEDDLRLLSRSREPEHTQESLPALLASRPRPWLPSPA